VGLSGGLETLCGQGYGAKLYKKLGLYLQASCIVSLFFSIIISILWWFTEPILVFLHQTPNLSKETALYMRYLIPGIFAYGILQNILRFLQMQSVVLPLVTFSLVPLLLHCGLTYLLVHCTSLGYKGAALATSMTFWLSVIVLLIYVNFTKRFEHTWNGLSKESLCYVFTNSKLALPSAAMVCFEDGAFEILVFVNTQAIAFMFTYGLSAAASTRVSNELGAGNTNQAKQAMSVATKLSILLGGLVLIALAFGHDTWAGFFRVCRGCGWQHLAMYINLGTFYLIGMPIACLLAFKFHLYAKGLWIGLVCGLIAQSGSLFLITHLLNWSTIELSTTGNDNFVIV
ncbi:Protein DETOXIFICATION 19, partial [Bienertia sinuspersici]